MPMIFRIMCLTYVVKHMILNNYQKVLITILMQIFLKIFQIIF